MRLSRILLLFITCLGTSTAPTHAASLPTAPPPLPLCAGPGSAYPPHSFPRVLHIGKQPASLAVSERTRHVFVVNVGERNLYGPDLICHSTLTTLDAATGRFIRTVAVGEAPGGPLVDDADGRVFLLTHRVTQAGAGPLGQDAVVVLDTNGRLLQRKPIAPTRLPRPVALSRSTHRLFVVSGWNVLTYDTGTLTLLNTMSVGQPRYSYETGVTQTVVDERDSRVFVLSGHGIVALDAHTGALIQIIDSGDYTDFPTSLAFDDQTDRLFFTVPGGYCRGGHNDAGIKAFSAATGKLVRFLRGDYCLGLGPTTVIEPGRRVLVYAPAIGLHSYILLDAGDGRLLRTLQALPLLDYRTVDRYTGLIYFAAHACQSRGCSDTVQVLDPRTWRIVRTIPVSHAWQGILVVAQGAHRVFVANPWFDSLTMFSTLQ